MGSMRKMSVLTVFCLLFLVIALTSSYRTIPQTSSEGTNGIHKQRPIFEDELPNVVEFSNSTGTRLECRTKGYPKPVITWILSDGSTVGNVQRLRHVTSEGVLVFPPFSAEDYRQDVHSVMYRCLASNVVGTIVSGNIHVKGIIYQLYDAHVYDVYVIKGNNAVVKCHIPAFLSGFVSVASWLRNDRYFINSTAYHDDVKYIMLPEGDLLIRDTDTSDHGSTYKCKIFDRLSTITKTSISSGKVFVTEPQTNIPPQFLTTQREFTVTENSTLVLPCIVHGHPVPTVAWFHSNDHGILIPKVQDTFFGLLIIPNIQISNFGVYICRANNSIATEEIKITISVHVPLSVATSPKELIVDVGNSAKISCEVTGSSSSVALMEWMKDGKRIEETQGITQLSPRSLFISSVRSIHRGLYQCFATIDTFSAYDVSGILLGDTPPEILSSFEEQTLHPEASVRLECLVSGTPLPVVSWELDGIPLDKSETIQDKNGQSKSVLNLMNIQPDQGGVYTCKASNKVGSVYHSAKINVYGPLMSRPAVTLSAIERGQVRLYCPVHGYPMTSINWKKGNTRLPENRRQQVFNNGTLELINLQKRSDAGNYECTATNSKGETANGIVVLTILVPPKITPFSFQEDLVREGMRARIQCVISEGDLPLRVRWTKDNQVIDETQGIIIRDLDEFSSILTIPSVTPRHNGNYSCTATNAAGSVHHSARLSVNDDQFFKGMRAHIICAVSQGDLPVEFKWLKDGKHIPQSLGVVTRNIDSHANSLSIESVSSVHSGNYTCVSKNDAATVMHTAELLVYVAPKISPFSFQDHSSLEGSFARITCLVYQGDLPISLHWLKDGRHIQNEEDMSIRTIDEYSSILTIAKVNTNHSGNYSCVASNAAATATFTAELKVYVPPKIVPFAFQDENLVEGMLVRVSCVVSRGDLPLQIRWLKDNKPIPAEFSISTRDFDDYSSVLSIDPVSSKHTGNYTCIVTNHAGSASHTASLIIYVQPRWIIKPGDQNAVKGSSLIVDCKAEGYPQPIISWKKLIKKDNKVFEENIYSGLDKIVYNNGSLYFRKITENDKSDYTCFASNGIGVELTRNIHINIQSPVYFAHNNVTKTTKKDSNIVLNCQPYGDPPIAVKWIRNDEVIESKRDLAINNVRTIDNGKYECRASNNFGNATMEITLIVQDVPFPPNNVAVRNIGNKSVEMSWNVPEDMFSPIKKYSIQYKKKQDSWTSRSVELTLDSSVTATIIRDLQPATVYMFRVASENDVGIGNYSEVVDTTIAEEAPEGVPQQITVESVDPQTLRISWKPPKKNLWNGIIRGYNIGHRIHNSTMAYIYNTLEVPEDYTEDLIYQLTNLQMFTKYSIVIQAYNSGGKGPLSDDVTVMTSEDKPSQPPRNVRCSSLSSRSIYLIWEPPVAESHNGIVRDYKILFKPIEDWHDGSLGFAIANTSKTTLTGLETNTNYSLQVLAFTKAGEGVKSDEIFCKTHEDVPNAPETVKVLPVSANSVLLSWIPPKRSNGAITKYTIYYISLGDGKELKEIDIQNLQDGVNVRTVDKSFNYYEVKGLQKEVPHAFWITAVSAIGESPRSNILTMTPKNKEIPAQMASFNKVLKATWKENLELPCRGVGIPVPDRTWFSRGKVLEENEKLIIRFDGTLVIKDANENDSAEYTCKISNSLGNDQVRYAVTVLVPPGPPILDVISKSLFSIHLNWKPTSDGGEPISEYILQYRRQSKSWEKLRFPASVSHYNLKDLACGATYELYMEATNKIGTGNRSEVITVTTQGDVFQLPEKDQIIQEGATFATINFNGWPSGNCPVIKFKADYQPLGTNEWIIISDNIKPTQKKMVISNLEPATWYVLRIMAYTSEEDFNNGEFTFSTRSLSGATIPPHVLRKEEKVVLFYLDPMIFIPAVGLVIFVIVVSVTTYVCCKRRSPNSRNQMDWNRYAGTIPGGSEMGMSIDNTFPREIKGSFSRPRSFRRRDSDDTNLYASVNISDYDSDRTLEHQRKRASQEMQRMAINSDAWINCAPGTSAGIAFDKDGCLPVGTIRTFKENGMKETTFVFNDNHQMSGNQA